MRKEKFLTLNEVNFEILRGAKAHELVEDYRRAERRGYTHLWQVYTTNSRKKDEAFDDCLAINRQVGGSIMYINTYCIMTFTLVYAIFTSTDKVYIVKETPSHRYICETVKGALR